MTTPSEKYSYGWSDFRSTFSDDFLRESANHIRMTMLIKDDFEVSVQFDPADEIITDEDE